MNSKAKTVELDLAYKFGCNRYLQGQNILELTAQEVLYKGSKPFIITSPKALEATNGRVIKSLEDANMKYELNIWTGQTTYEQSKTYAKMALDSGCDVVVAIGGGRIMDLGKASAAYATLPIINIPTIIATCAAFAPLSVMYTAEGASLGSLRHKHEVDAILVDMDVIVNEPARYVASGILDGMAKFIEMQNGNPSYDIDTTHVSLLTSLSLAKFTTELYKKQTDKALEDVANKTISKAIEDIAYTSVAVTGVISGASKGFGQSALGHETYELIRTHFTQEAKDYLHGEIVALALPMQLAYNEQEDQIEELRSWMRQMNMPIYLSDINIPETEENVDLLFDKLYHSNYVEETPENYVKLKRAVTFLVK